MQIVGISGGPNSVTDTYLRLPNESFHDSSAAMIRDGQVIAAYEEERFSRIKHTNLFPAAAVTACLGHLTGQSLPDLIAFSVGEKFLSEQLISQVKNNHWKNAAEFIAEILFRHCKFQIDPQKICFYDHHYSHAAAAYFQSGFEKSLVITVDGAGDGYAGKIYDVDNGRFRLLRILPIMHSLGNYYLYVTRHLGFDLFDEYKVMGLAPYGDAAVYKDFFSGFYQLLPNGEYTIDRTVFYKLRQIARPRKPQEEIQQVHKDIAAALQHSLETIMFHIADHFRKETGHSDLCMAGGVALNCKMTGELLYSALFENIFVHPASADNGLSIGAALACHYERHEQYRPHRLKHVYWGSDIEKAAEIENEISKWEGQLIAEEATDIAAVAARLVADNKVIGWFQGRSEFGPRALGNRSIIADPRPFSNREKINAIIKMREGFRPFAPSVLEELTDEYFECGHSEVFPFMTFILKVKPAYQEILQAVTHVDGTARIQTVSKETNPRYWELINEFYRLTGIAMVLNTSFNSNVEPIVDTPRQAIICFLTNQLEHLIIGDFVLTKKPKGWQNIGAFRLQLPKHVALTNAGNDCYTLRNLYNTSTCNISKELSVLLQEKENINDSGLAVAEEVKTLLSLRMIDVSP